MSIPMMHPVTLETVQRYAVNSGMLVRDLDWSKITNAEAFVTAVTAQDFADKILGATSGSTTISENRKMWTPDHNGLRVPFKGSQFLDSAQPSIKATLVEMSPANIQLMSGAADVTGEDSNAITITPRATFKEGDYVGSLTWFTNYGSRGIIGATITNALCVSGLNWSVNDKKIATCDVEFLAHADSPVFSDALPIKYFIFLNSENA